MRRKRSAPSHGHEVVGLYGDPDTTWGIAVEAGLRGPLPVDAEHRLAGIFAAHPHLGRAGTIETVPPGDWSRRRAALVAAPYRRDEPQVRVAVAADEDRGDEGAGQPRLLVAAHHGVIDGLGLLALVQGVAGVSLEPLARGIGHRAAAGSFLSTAPRRLAEALRAAPVRFPALADADASGETLLERTVPRSSVGTVELCLALSAEFSRRRRLVAEPGGSPLFFVGASRRDVGSLAPDRQTAYLRFRVDPRWSLPQARERFGLVAPEPDFPETSLAGIGPVAAKLFRNRLGSTALVSNLGVVSGSGVRSLSMFPALSGPRAVAVGLASTEHSTTITLRTRATDYARDDAAALFDAVCDTLLDRSGRAQ